MIKVFAGVADRGANMLAAMRMFDDEFVKVPCSAHRINLAVGDLLKEKKIKFKGIKPNSIFYSHITINNFCLF